VARNIKLIRTWSMFMPSLQALIGFSFLIVLWQGGHQLLRARFLSAPDAFLYLPRHSRLAHDCPRWVTNIFQRGAASWALNYILHAQPQIDDRSRSSRNAAVAGEVEFRNWNFTYPTTISGMAPGFANPTATIHMPSSGTST